jgi:two-component system phosphate regulon response regulator PhoB
MDTILLVEDDRDIAQMISTSLGRAGYRVIVMPDAEHAHAFLKDGAVSAILLDIMLPGMDGFAFIRKLKKNPALSAIPIIITSAKDDDTDVVAGLELGAEDYIVKPFSLKVLEARLRAVLRRSDASYIYEGSSLRVQKSGILLDSARHEVRSQDLPVDLSATEFAILEVLLKNPGMVFSRDRLITEIRGGDVAVTERSIDVHILSIRRKLGEKGSLIETVRGVGYRFRDE